MKIKVSTIGWFMFAFISCISELQAQPELLWSRTYGGEQAEWCYSAIQTADGGFALAGATWSFGEGEYTVENLADPAYYDLRIQTLADWLELERGAEIFAIEWWVSALDDSGFTDCDGAFTGLSLGELHPCRARFRFDR